MADTTTAVSPLRRRMIDDMMLRNLSPATGSKYAHRYKLFHDPILSETVLERLRQQSVEHIKARANLERTKHALPIAIDRPAP